MKQKLPHEGASDTAVLIPTEPLEWLRWQGNQFGSDPMYDRCAAEIERLRVLVADIVVCTHRPNPTDPTRIDIAPGKHRLFQAAIERVIALERQVGDGNQ